MARSGGMSDILLLFGAGREGSIVGRGGCSTVVGVSLFQGARGVRKVILFLFLVRYLGPFIAFFVF